ncbi:hypothetical protein [Psychrobacillus sp. MER TA 171]|uniref:hypothetical protein n=1 Tax=Psychrobacillus sp. MER TA 171 TaxID=2939577 RepID=UPI00203CA7ED|nr:hypothetical protein [Psychrobacillus sp. MER TA 171]MCM3358667.1 hypothetical protein [Psychrobacillus sp. MER TA 171]
MSIKTFRTLDQAKKDLQEIHEYVELISNYNPQNIVQLVIQIYVMYGSIAKTAAILNSQGYTIEQVEVSAIIKSTPHKDDLLHKKVKSLYLKKTRSSRIVNKSYF